MDSSLGYIQITGFSSVAAIAFLAWDIMLNFADEVSYVWGWKNNWWKALYCILRYCPLLLEIVFLQPVYKPRLRYSPDTCAISALVESVLQQLIMCAVGIVSVFRVYILYDQSKIMLVGMVILYLASVAVSFMIPLQSMQFNEYCLVMYAPGSVVAAWIAPATFEAVMMLFVLYKSARYVCLFNHFESQPILQVFIRDGIWALALIVVVTVITALSYTGIICNAVISGSFYFWNLSIYSFAGSHVLLNMRQVGTRMNDFPTAYSSTIWSDLQFGPNDVSIASDNEECYDLETDFPLEVCAESDKRTCFH